MSLCQSSFVCGRHSVFYVCFTCYYFRRHCKTVWERERKREAIPTASPVFLPSKKKRIKQKYFAVARLVSPTSSLLLPSTVYTLTRKIILYIMKKSGKRPNSVMIYPSSRQRFQTNRTEMRKWSSQVYSSSYKWYISPQRVSSRPREGQETGEQQKRCIIYHKQQML